MEFSFSKEILQDLRRIKKTNLPLARKIQKQLELFKKDHRHPSLRTHKLKGHLQNTWSISVEGNVRMIFTIVKNEAIFFKIGNHDEVYKK